MTIKIKKYLLVILSLILIAVTIPSVNVEAAALITKCDISISKTSYNFTGSQCKPKVTVTYKGKTLKSGTDYTVSYSNNIYAGTATVTIKGKGKYSGTEKKKFSIKNKLTVTVNNFDNRYTGNAIKPGVEVMSGKTKLSAADYTVSYRNNKNVGTAYIIVKGKGKYAGKNAGVPFTIQPVHIDNADEDAITIDKNNDTYEAAGNVNESGELKAGQRAVNILSGFKAENGATKLNHPNGIASDGSHFVVCDTWNNRVLVYNSLPDKNTKPDLVIGQKNFKSFTAGNGPDQLNWPVSATFAGKKLIIADTHNNRLLVYNSVPTTNGAKADVIIKSLSETDDIIWPWAVWSDGTKLIVTSTRNGKVGFWDKVDSAVSGEYADRVINLKGTPRTIISDGNYLLIGDHNLNGSGSMGSHIWKNYPADGSMPDFTINVQYGGAIIGGNLYGISNDSNYYVYKGLIDNPSEQPAESFGNIKGYMQAGDFNQILYVGGKTYACYYNSSVIAIYDGKITKDNYMKPIGYLGSKANVKSANVDNGIYQNPIPATDGKSLVLVDDYNRLIAVYKKIPDTNNVKADVIYNFGSHWDYPIDIAIDSKGKMFVLTAKAVLVWDKIPLNGEMYNARVEFDYDIGKDNSHIEVDDDNLYIFSQRDSKLFKLDKNSKSYSFKNALQTIAMPDARGLTSGSGYLIVTSNQQSKVTVYKTANLEKYGEVYSNRMENHLNLSTDAILLPNGQFAVADNNRLRVWRSLDVAITDRDFTECFELGTLDNYNLRFKDNGNEVTESPSLATDGSLFTPTNLAYANGHLWVGEFKFSSRLVRYDLK
ncbi:MAG: hypothetical protein MJ131_05205 [Lachnospiraceae bacterium]|nr:hypothetical protein [Lachnospiraceae bacterium]